MAPVWARVRWVALALALAGVALPATASGQAWLTPAPLSPGAASTEGADVAGDAAGNAVAVWIEGGTIQSATRVAHGAWTAPRPLSTAGRAAQSPQVEMDAHGRVLVVWAEETPGGGQEIRHRTGSAAEGLGASAPLSAIDAGESAVEPRAAVNAAGAAAVVWTVTVAGAGPDRVHGVARDSAGERFGLPVQLSALAATDDARVPRVVLDARGNTVAVWHQRGTPERVDSAVRAAGGQWRALPVADGWVSPSMPPALAVAPSGRAFAAWGGGDDALRLRLATRGTTPAFDVPAWDPPEHVGSPWGDVDVAIRADGTPVVFREALAGTWDLIGVAPPSESAVGLNGYGGFARLQPWGTVPHPGGLLVHWNDGRGLATRLWRSDGSLGAIESVGTGVSGRAGLTVDDEGNTLAVWVGNGGVWTSTWDAQPPAFATVAVPEASRTGAEVQLEATATDRWSDPVVTWDFGDGTGATGARVSHTFATVGRSTITVTATDRVGLATTVTRTLEVLPPPLPAPPVDGDGDGAVAAVDCNDGNPAIRPTAPEVRGNAVDENCDGVIAPFPFVNATARLTTQYEADRSTRLLRLELRDLARGDTIRLSCRGRGCRSRMRAVLRHTTARSSLSLTSRVRGARLKPGAQLEIAIERPAHVGRVFTFAMRASKTGVPKRTTRCVVPSTTKRITC